MICAWHLALLLWFGPSCIAILMLFCYQDVRNIFVTSSSWLEPSLSYRSTGFHQIWLRDPVENTSGFAYCTSLVIDRVTLPWQTRPLVVNFEDDCPLSCEVFSEIFRWSVRSASHSRRNSSFGKNNHKRTKSLIPSYTVISKVELN